MPAGHRFFTLTPIVADFSGPIIANTFWYPPDHGPLDGMVATRTVVATRVAGHLFREFVLERRHQDRPIDACRPHIGPRSLILFSRNLRYTERQWQL